MKKYFILLSIALLASVNVVFAADGPINGACGSAAQQTFSSLPTENLCAAGSVSNVAGTGPWIWFCDGSGGGTSAYCFANKSGILSLNVLTPNGEEEFKIGNTITISWKISGAESTWNNQADSVELQLWNDGAYASLGTICVSCASQSTSGSYAWTVGRVYDANNKVITIAPGKYRIRATLVSSQKLNNYPIDLSDRSFTISAADSVSGTVNKPLSQMNFMELLMYLIGLLQSKK
jgi:hypothetical protein